MITSLSYKSVHDPINGDQVRNIRMLKEERDAMLEGIRQEEFEVLPMTAIPCRHNDDEDVT
eukprot:3525104-Amphidinium_carterae.1